MVHSLGSMVVGKAGMIRGFFMVSRLMLPGGFLMVIGRPFMLGGCFLVMVRCLVKHVSSPSPVRIDANSRVMRGMYALVKALVYVQLTAPSYLIR